MADGQDQMAMFETSPTDDRPPGQPGEDRDLRPGRDAESAIPVSEVNAAARELLEESFPPLWVAGEIANWRQVSSGHCYFSLRDEDAQIQCVMWRRNARRLPTEPEEGMEVCAHGQISLYEVRGTYQLMVRQLQARGEGLWRLAFERLKKKLAAEGLLDEARKRPTPRVPGRVAVVTSRSGAALRDVVSVIRRRAPWTDILVADCRVQGEEAAPEIVAALERVGRRDDVDVVILTRGGGSVEDLWAFNEEPVARAVAASPIPVISAVGHEVDVTIADLVADVRAPTPSAAAEVAVPAEETLRAEVAGLASGLADGLRSRVRRGRDRAGRYAERLLSAARRRLDRARSRTERLGARLDALSPLGTLRRGYAVPTDEDGQVLRRRESFEGVERFRLRVVDGRIEARVENVEPAPEPDAGGGEA
ncbi:MAG: exodeoxyribonuclease VII large subunit [Candidatus Palauibacterales bacterium]|nr:exodeoxyribonuclease VII large subunit [Candidatus Palauibacterales bacterium]